MIRNPDNPGRSFLASAYAFSRYPPARQRLLCGAQRLARIYAIHLPAAKGAGQGILPGAAIAFAKKKSRVESQNLLIFL